MIKRSHYLLIGTIILLFAVWLRLHNLLNFPTFGDEFFHIRRAQEISTGAVFTGIFKNKWLYSLFLALFNPRAFDSLFLGNVLSVLASFMTCALCMAMGTALFKRPIGLLAGFFYVIFPLAVLQERTALVDAQLVMFCAMVTLVSYRLAKKPRIWLGVLLLVAMLGANLTKATGVLFYVVPAFASILFGTSLTNLIKGLTISTIATISAALIRLFIYTQAALAGEEVIERFGATSSNLLFAQVPFQEALASMLSDTSKTVGAYAIYAGPVFILSLILCVVWILRREQWREYLYLLIPGVGFLSTNIIFVRPSGDLPGRYLLLTAPLLVVVATAGYLFLLNRLPRNTLLQQSLLALFVVPPLLLSLGFTHRDPITPIMYRLDRINFIDENDTKEEEAAAHLLADAIVTDADGTYFHTFLFGQVEGMQIYAGHTQGAFYRLPHENPANINRVFQNMALTNDKVYLVRQIGYESMEAPDYLERTGFAEQGTDLGLVGNDAQQFHLIRLDWLEGDMAASYYEQVTDIPEVFASDYEMMMPNLVDGRDTFAYPGTHAEYLTVTQGLDVEGFTVDYWPLSNDSIEQAIEGVGLPIAEATLFDFIITDAAHTDPRKTLLHTLFSNAYYVSDEYVGRVHRLTFAGTSQTPDMQIVGTLFEDTIELLQVGINRQATETQDLLLMNTEWTIRNSVGDSFIVFTHVVDENGMLIAQYDSVPLRGIRPLTTWEPGELIQEQYAIQLPDDLAPGTYNIVIGLYFPESGVRLVITDGPDRGETAANVGLLMVE